MSRPLLHLLRPLRLAARANTARYTTAAIPQTPQRAQDLAAAEAISESDSAQPPQPATTSPSTRTQKPKKVYTPPALAPLPPPRYHVARSSNKNLPIYTDYKRGGNLHLTTVRKISGDPAALRDELRELLRKKDEDVVVNPLTGHVVVKGHHTAKIADFLKERGM